MDIYKELKKYSEKIIGKCKISKNMRGLNEGILYQYSYAVQFWYEFMGFKEYTNIWKIIHNYKYINIYISIMPPVYGPIGTLHCLWYIFP